MKVLKSKIAFSIDPGLLQRVDSMVDGRTVKSRSHALELLIRKGLGVKTTEALILAGGERSASAGLKPLAEFNGKPAILHLLEWLKKFGVTDITIAVGKRGKEIEDAVSPAAVQGLKISYLREKEPLGTAGTLRLAREKFKSTFLVVNGDVVCDFNLEKLLEQHAKEKAVVTIALTDSPDTSMFGAVELEGLLVTGFVEKPAPGKEPSRLVNAGVCACEPDLFGFLPKTGSLEKEIFPKLAEKSLLYGFVFTGFWTDVSKHASKK